MKKRFLVFGVALTLGLLGAIPAMAWAGGSDSTTPYSVTKNGISLPSGDTFPDNGHVNIRLTDGTSKGIHFESLNWPADHPKKFYIGKDFLPWSAFGLDKDEVCVKWVQISLYNEHFGEGGQEPVGKGCKKETPTPTPTPTEPEDNDHKIGFCHKKAGFHETDLASFFNAGHIDHEDDIFPAGKVWKQGEWHSWEAQGDQSLLTTNCMTPTPTPTPTPTEPTPTPTTTVTPTPTPTPSPSDTPTPTPSETPTVTPTPTPSETPTVTPTPTPSETGTPTPSPTPTEPTVTPTPSETPTPTVTPTPTETPTASPSPSVTPSKKPKPSTTPTPEHLAFTGGDINLLWPALGIILLGAGAVAVARKR